MAFSCPKCGKPIEQQREITFVGKFEKCEHCSTRVWIQKESSILRPFKKHGPIYCARCENLLDPALICKKCGELFPDYFLCQTSKPKYIIDKQQFEFRIPKFGRRKKIVLEKASPSFRFGRLVPIACLILIIGISGFGWHLYNSYKEKKEYMNNFVMALYGLKTGADVGVSVCGQADKNVLYTFNETFSVKSNKVKKEVDSYLEKLQSPPSEFLTCSNYIAELNSIYGGIYLHSMNYKGSLSSYCEEARRMESSFQNTALKLKVSLPAELAETIASASLKFKKLKFIVD